jgi:hypothetical protein
MNEVSITVPVIRPKGFEMLVDSIKKNAGIPESQYEIVHIIDVNREGGVKTLNKCVEKAKYDIICFLADDSVIRENCIKNALEVMLSFPDGWGMVGINDGYHSGKAFATHWMAHKKLLPYLGGKFAYEGYRYICADKEISQRCMALGRYKHADNALLIHNTIQDADRIRVATQENIDYDRNLYEIRSSKSLGWTRIDLLDD